MTSRKALVKTGLWKSSHDFHRGCLPPLPTVVPYFDQGEEDADEHQQRTENFGNVGHTLQIRFEHTTARKLVSLHDRPCHTRNAAIGGKGDEKSASHRDFKGPQSDSIVI